MFSKEGAKWPRYNAAEAFMSLYLIPIIASSVVVLALRVPARFCEDIPDHGLRLNQAKTVPLIRGKTSIYHLLYCR